LAATEAIATTAGVSSYHADVEPDAL